MKKYTIFIILMSAYSAIYSQESKESEALIKEVKQLTLFNINLEKELQTSKDSIKRLDSLSRINMEALNKKIVTLETDKTDLNKQIKKLDKNNIKGLEASMKQQAELLDKLKDSIKNKDSLIAGIKNENAKKELEKFKEGQQTVYDKIGKTYQNSTFDSLIKYTTKRSIERDSQFVINNAEAVKKWKSLQIYFLAQQVLKEKYDDQKLKIAQAQLNNVSEKSELLDELKNRLSNYKECTEGLKNTIAEINNYDKKFTGNDDETKKAKQRKVAIELSSYFYDYNYNFNDSQYISDIILEIMKLKLENANTDISKLSSKL